MKKSIFIRMLCIAVAATALCLSACANGGSDTQSTDTTVSETESMLETLGGEVAGTGSLNVGGYDSPFPSVTAAATTKAPDSITDVESTSYSKGLAYISLGNGTCTVSGIGSCTDTCVVIPRTNPNGEIVVSISDKAFFGSSVISAVFLPSSIASIGNMAFAACPALAYFSVDAGNLAYRDVAGVLYTADGTTIISYPAAKSSASVTIPASVRNIADMAFYGCTKLQTVAYAGTLAQWQQISVGSGNNSLIGLNIQYQSSGK
ncbi:MAG: hypothetical protein E7589_08530 [Ruminococcaceae bacterium]|nr:hypothetical protein [Oscillospiraceae bacterium]